MKNVSRAEGACHFRPRHRYDPLRKGLAMRYRDDEDDEIVDGADVGDRDAPDAFDADDEDDGDDEETETVPCPYCRRQVPEGVAMCPYCRSFISFEDAPRRRPWWLVAGVIVCLLIVVLWVVS